MKKATKLREEFVIHPELAGSYGYCNQVFANKIADWWLAKYGQMERDAYNSGYEQAKTDLLGIPQEGGKTKGGAE